MRLNVNVCGLQMVQIYFELIKLIVLNQDLHYLDQAACEKSGVKVRMLHLLFQCVGTIK